VVHQVLISRSRADWKLQLIYCMEYGNIIPDFFIKSPNIAGGSFCSVGHDLLAVVAGVPSLLERAKMATGVGTVKKVPQ
jgi:hypothetical protein